jgi:pilus assembly protein TadC
MLEYRRNGEILAQWDDVTRIFTSWASGEPASRAYTDVENAAADLRAVQDAEEANRQTIEAEAGDALTELQAIIDATNAQLNTNPAAHIKTLARVLRRIIRLVLRRFEATT